MDAKTETAEEGSAPAEDTESGADYSADTGARKLRELLALTLIARLTGRVPTLDDEWRA